MDYTYFIPDYDRDRQVFGSLMDKILDSLDEFEFPEETDEKIDVWEGVEITNQIGQETQHNVTAQASQLLQEQQVMYNGSFFQSEIGLGQGMKSACLLWDIYLDECITMAKSIIKDEALLEEILDLKLMDPAKDMKQILEKVKDIFKNFKAYADDQAIWHIDPGILDLRFELLRKILNLWGIIVNDSKTIRWSPGSPTFKYLGFNVAQTAKEALLLVGDAIATTSADQIRMDFMHWNSDKYQATKGSALKEQVIPTLVLFPVLTQEIRKILSEKQRAVVFSKSNDAKKLLPRYGEQAQHMDGILIMCLSQLWKEVVKFKEREIEEVRWIKNRIKVVLENLGWLESAGYNDVAARLEIKKREFWQKVIPVRYSQLVLGGVRENKSYELIWKGVNLKVSKDFDKDMEEFIDLYKQGTRGQIKTSRQRIKNLFMNHFSLTLKKKEQ